MKCCVGVTRAPIALFKEKEGYRPVLLSTLVMLVLWWLRQEGHEFEDSRGYTAGSGHPKINNKPLSQTNKQKQQVTKYNVSPFCCIGHYIVLEYVYIH